MLFFLRLVEQHGHGILTLGAHLEVILADQLVAEGIEGIDVAFLQLQLDLTQRSAQLALGVFADVVGQDEMQSMIDDGKDIEVSCQFCDKVYTYTPDDLKKLMKKGNN